MRRGVTRSSRSVECGSVAILTLAFLAIAILAARSNAATWEVIRLTETRGREERNPQISGSNVVWDGNGIFFFDGEVTRRISDGFISDGDPDISGESVVWTEPSGEIFLYTNNQTVQFGHFGIRDLSPRISLGNIAWLAKLSAPTFLADVYLDDGLETLKLFATSEELDLSPLVTSCDEIASAGIRIRSAAGNLSGLSKILSDADSGTRSPIPRSRGFGSTSTVIFRVVEPE